MNGPANVATVSDPCAPYESSEAAPWNLRRVVHLHHRAGFAATWSELQRDLEDGAKASIDRVLAGTSRLGGGADEFDSIANMLGREAARAEDIGRLKAWWLYRMLCGPDSLTERLTLFWHNYFATSADKVGMAVYQQNQIFREFARAPFAELLTRVVRDPAMLLWLDAQVNRKGQPNENLARELMELFTLGIGHYDEHDVKEAARALTGWTVVDGQFREEPMDHDEEEKSILGQRGRWKGDDLIKMLLEHPATAQRLASQLCQLLLGEEAIDAAFVHTLAAGVRDRNLDMGWAVETILRSKAFFSDANLNTRVLGPVEYVVGAASALQFVDKPPNTLILAEYVAILGQDLFRPPNVGGWTGGRAWINSRSTVGRYNYAIALVEGEPVGRVEPLDALGLAGRCGRGGDLEDLIKFYAELFLGYWPGNEWSKRLMHALQPASDTKESQNARSAVALVLTCPEGQLA